MGSPRRFELTAGVDLDAIQVALGPGLHLVPAQDRSEARLHLDTWEALLFRANWRLHAESADAGRARLALARPGEAPLASEELSEVPAFAWEFPEGPLRGLLTPVIKARRLLPLAELGRAVRPYRVVDAAGRAVAGLEVDRISAGLPDASRPPVEAPVTLEVVSLGDDEAAGRIAGLLTRVPGLTAKEADPLVRALEALGRVPADNPVKLVLQLDPEAPAREALRRICRRLLTAIELCVDGTRAQLDIEFLHDLRVSSRRSRAALSQLKKVFGRGAVARFRADLKRIGTETGTARDLDVFLLRWDRITGPMGGPDRAALRPVQERLVQRRERVQRDVVGALDSDWFRAFLRDWAAFLDGGPPGGKHADRPTRSLARSRIRKRHGKVLARGAGIGPDSPAEELHEMRLDCKKLRYLLEMFRSLDTSGQIGGLIKELKRFQDTLGDFNDVAIQRELLAGLDGLEPATAAALERLLSSLRDRQTQLRQQFAGRFTRFASEQVTALFEGLFA